MAVTIEDKKAIADDSKLPGNWKVNRMWVRNDADFRSRLEQVANHIHRNMSTIVRDGAERELKFLLDNHPKLEGFKFVSVEEWLKIRPSKIG